MRTINVTEAKAKFADLVRAVEAGEEIALTRHGKPVAYLSRELKGRAKRSKEEVRAIMEEARKLRERQKPVSVEEVREMINEGRKY